MNISSIVGVIFDVDDTLLDNYSLGPLQGLHEIARLKAAHQLGAKYNLPKLLAFTPEQSLLAFQTASIHTVTGATWNMLVMGEVVKGEVEPDHDLLKELITVKDVIYAELVKKDGREIPNASRFVRALDSNTLHGRMAIASSGIRRDIDAFLKRFGLTDVFEDRIQSFETVTKYKPDPEVFNNAFQMLELPESSRRSVLVFEDHPRGISSAKAAGLYVCGITTLFTKNELADLPLAPDLIADSYEEFATLLGIQL